MKRKTNLSSYDNSWYKPGNRLKIIIWYLVNELLIKNRLFPFSKLKILVLRCFGAQIGVGVKIKSNINIKYPWNLKLGNYCLIEENVWIDNLSDVIISDNVILGQGSMLLCGNHNYKKTSFDLFVKPIIIEESVCIGAKSIICPGVTIKSHTIVNAGTVITFDLDSNSLIQGNPQKK